MGCCCRRRRRCRWAGGAASRATQESTGCVDLGWCRTPLSGSIRDLDMIDRDRGACFSLFLVLFVGGRQAGKAQQFVDGRASLGPAQVTAASLATRNARACKRRLRGPHWLNSELDARSCCLAWVVDCLVLCGCGALLGLCLQTARLTARIHSLPRLLRLHSQYQTPQS